MSDATTETSTSTTLDSDLFDKVEEATKARDDGKVANRVDYDNALAKLGEIEKEVAEEVAKAYARQNATAVTRRVLDRLYRANNDRLDREYKETVFGDEAANVSNYDI